jgi:hypothetical protein
VASTCVVLLWIASRTIGLPIGPEPWTAESVGAIDVLASLDELLIGVLSAGVLTVTSQAAGESALRLLGPLSYLLVVASGVALFSTSGHGH